MKKSSALLLAAFLATGGGVEVAVAGFGDAVVGGVVGGVVGSVITNGIIHSRSRHRSTTRHRTRKRHRSAPKPVVESDEMKIQRALKSLGYYRGPIDGAINSFETRTAIKEFNRAYEIGDSAYMSPQERDALIYLGTLLKMDRALIAQGTDRRSKTKRIQAALKVLGHYPGKVDGATGPMTRRAISSYRQASGLAPGTSLGYEDEYRLITTAKQANDRNIQETLASLKRIGAQNNQMRQPVVNQAVRQPVVLQPAAMPPAPVQPTITQSAPAPRQSAAVPAMAPAPLPQAPAARQPASLAPTAPQQPAVTAAPVAQTPASQSTVPPLTPVVNSPVSPASQPMNSPASQGSSPQTQ